MDNANFPVKSAPGSMTMLVKWALALLGIVVLVLGAVWARALFSNEHPEAADEAMSKKLEGGRIKLSLMQAEANIRTAPVEKIDWLPRVPVYGRVVNNPSAVSEVRAAFAGRLRAADKAPWPALAARVKSGTRLGDLEVRPPQDRLDLASKASEAKLKWEGARRIWTLQQDRVKRLELAQPSIARSDLDAALVALAEAETQLAVSEAAAKLWQDALTTLTQNGDPKQITWTLPIVAPADGEITELVGRPNMTVEAGTLIAKIVDYRKGLVRLDVPFELTPPREVELSLLPPTPPAFAGPTNRPEPAKPGPRFTATLIGAAPDVNATLQAAGYLYQAQSTDKETTPAGTFRPGVFIKALVAGAGKSEAALVVPRSALVYHQGRALVYVQARDNDDDAAKDHDQTRHYQRIEVRVLGSVGDKEAVRGALSAGDLVVSEGAVYLLSAEFRTDSDD